MYKRPDGKFGLYLNISSWRYPHNMSIKSYAKVNLFLKITGYKDGYHTLLSRFARSRQSI